MSDDIRQGVTPAAHAVLDAVDYERGNFESCDWLGVLSHASADAMAARNPGNLKAARDMAITAAARLLLAIELIDEEIGS